MPCRPYPATRNRPTNNPTMATVKTFEDFEIWQMARAINKTIYAVTRRKIFTEDVDLRRQIRKASVSCMSNIAEGFERGGGDKEFRHFLSIAKGSPGEVRCQLYVALDAGHLAQPEFDELSALAMDVSRLLSRFMRYLAPGA